ncbi:hypothetical protein B0T16DRAFT_460280 [Cercophora newfieldiana]|uniref:Uncharacterized protein n=1 Tax=Cercophora newfieldiana TaxID=92897 RepID=A0AA39Y1D4_9PEZI|nr:hypothetical protein B0T16DRAFT_460280 [Cercophora newfieldiana]
MDALRPTKNIKDEFNIALVVITTIFTSALYIFAGITAYHLNSLDSSLRIYEDARAAARGSRPRPWRHTCNCTCSGPLAVVKLLFIFFWPFFLAYVLGWGAVYWVWRGLVARGMGREGKVARRLREKLECERTMPFPRACRRLMGVERGDKKGGSAWSGSSAGGQSAIELGGKGEDVELGVTTRGKRAVEAEREGGKEGTAVEAGGDERVELGVPTGEQDIADGFDGGVEANEKDEPKSEGKSSPVFQLQQPSPPDRTSSLKRTPVLWTIPEEGDEVDIEIETMASRPVRDPKQDWSPI